MNSSRKLLVLAQAACLAVAMPLAAFAEELASWNDGPTKSAITDFVKAATTDGAPGWIAPEDRIAVFDNDGTLWSEQPAYFQAFFVFDRIKEMAPTHPEWKEQPPFKGVLEGDMSAVAASGEKGLMELLAVTHSGMTDEGFDTVLGKWLETARHPKTQRPFTEMTFAPMVELLDYLRDNGFQTWIVSGGGIDFMRPWTEAAYGVPPQQVVGSQIAKEYQIIDGKPQFMRKSDVFFVDDGAGKPIGIDRHIGKRPVMAFGNSDGDFQMLEYTTAGDGPRFAAIVHHTDADREYAYDRESSFGKLDKALDAAPEKGWLLIDMAKDWSRVYPDAK
ncbi:MAG TPA: HAD family hydrolase [Paracoccus sp. (in: a-proteobacteria)]|uniref:HAD family hydrolase n=1 Tax=Paracoccus sp. TaxID=267 RepID=UPI002CF2F584|nr:HAD family hydrolase [Paracoccus sp. (in: a-proteobacteria)]HWL56287.1 HAD family hydrolase [Paracoccus sp. (in: a-proteobacteria)]